MTCQLEECHQQNNNVVTYMVVTPCSQQRRWCDSKATVRPKCQQIVRCDSKAVVMLTSACKLIKYFVPQTQNQLKFCSKSIFQVELLQITSCTDYFKSFAMQKYVLSTSQLRLNAYGTFLKLFLRAKKNLIRESHERWRCGGLLWSYHLLFH